MILIGEAGGKIAIQIWLSEMMRHGQSRMVMAVMLPHGDGGDAPANFSVDWFPTRLSVVVR